MSSTDTRIALLKLRIETNKADAADAVKSIDKLRAGLREIDLAERQITPDAARAGAAIVKSNEAAKKSAVEAAKQTKELNNQIKQTGFLSEETRQKLGQIRTENRAESFATRTVANVLPGDIGNVSRELFDLVDTIPDLGVAFSVLKASIVDTLAVLGGGSALAGGALLGALALLGGVFLLLKQQADAAAEATKAAIERQYEYNKIIATGTQESIDKQLEANKLRQIEARLNLETAQKAVAAAYDALANAPILQDNSALVASYQAAGEAQNEALETLNELTGEEINLKNARKDALVIMNTEQEELERLIKRAQEAVDAAGLTRIDTLVQASKLSSQAARDRIADIENEMAILIQYKNSSDLSAEAIAGLDKRLENLRTTAATLSGQLDELDAKQQRADTIAAVKKYNEDVSKIEQQSRDAQAAAHEKYADSLVSIAERAADAAENALRKLREKQQDLALNLSRDVADADVQRAQEQLDAQIKFADEEAKAARQHANNLKQIRREGARDETQAIQDRDAVALDTAQRNTRQRLQDANRDYADQQRERRIAFAQELRDQQTQFAREAQARYTKYQRDLQDAQTQYNREIALAEQNRVQSLAKAAQNYAQEQAQLAQKYATERAQRQAAITAELAAIRVGYEQRLRIQTAYENQLVAQSQRILGRLGQSAVPFGSGGADTGHVIPFASGGNAPANRNLLVGERGPELVRFKQPSRIYSAGQTRSMGGGRSLTVNLQGATMKTIEATSKAHALEIVGIALDEMGAT